MNIFYRETLLQHILHIFFISEYELGNIFVRINFRKLKKYGLKGGVNKKNI